MEEKKFLQLLEETKQIRKEADEITDLWQDRLVSQMVKVAAQETDRLEHHLMEMPLSVIIYQWIIVRLKTRPWRILVPTSIALTLLLQSIFSKVNLLQIMVH